MTDPAQARTESAPLAFLAGGGEMGERIRAFDWSRTSLGPVEGWPQGLRSALSICLNSNFPIALYWGDDLVLLYNDEWSPIPGEKHPKTLGLPAREAWPEIWHIIEPLFRQVMTTGEATRSRDQLLPMHRHGFTEECYFDYTFSPVRGEGGEVQGVFNAVLETTTRVVGERRLRTLRELGARTTGEARSAEQACWMASQIIAENSHDVPFALLYLLGGDGRTATLAGLTGLGRDAPASAAVLDLDAPGAEWPFRRVAETGKPAEVSDLSARFGPLPGGAWPDSPHTAVVLPLAKSGQTQLAGFLVAGVSARLALDDDYRGFLDLLASHVATAVANARAYEEERKRAEALAELDRAKTAFFSNVSHEFRTPLALMLGPAEDALADAGDALPPAQRERVQVIHRNGLRLQRLVNTLLDFCRIEAGRVRASYEPTDLSAFTAELASNFRSACERAGLTLTVDCPPLGEPVFVDRPMWEKVVLNLLSNAFKFTFDGGIAVELRPVGRAVELRVRDTGTGIPADEMPRLFERFHRVENARGRTHEGSGIGLALVQELVRLHGGAITAESEAGTGTTFTATLPLGSDHLPGERVGAGGTTAPATTGASPFVEEALRWLPDAGESPDLGSELPTQPNDLSVPSSALRPDAERPRVLVADDNADMRRYVERLLAGSYTVESVADGVAALEGVRRQHPDLILSDVMMPRLDGFGLLRELRADPATAGIPVILLSARAGEESRVEGVEAGADNYLVKPFSARELLARVTAQVQMARLRREAGEAQRQSHAQFEALFNAAPIGVYLVDADMKLRQVNPKARPVFGDIPDLIGSDFGEVIHALWPKPYADEIEERFRHTLATGEPYSVPERVEERLDRKVTEYYEWQIHRIPLPDGRYGVVCYFNDISRHVLARLELAESGRRLRESEERYRTLFESMDEGYCVIEFLDGPHGPLSDYVHVQANPAYTANTGIPDIVGQKVREMVPDEAEAWVEVYRNVLVTGQPVRFERELVATGRHLDLAAFRIGPPELRQVAVLFKDITERKRAEEALREVEARFTAILDHSPSCIFAKDRQGRYLLANKALGEFTGRDAADLLGRTDADFFPADVAARFARDDTDLLASGIPRIYEESFPHAGTTVTSLTVKFPLVDAGGTPYAVCGIATDISDQKRAQDALRQSEERFRQLADAMPQIVWTARPDGNIDYLNRQWHEFTGLPATSGNDGWGQILHPDDASPARERWATSLGSGAPFEMEVRLLDRRTQTYRWHLIRTVAVHNGAGKVARWFGTSTDIHEQKRAEESSRYLAEASAALASVVDYESTLQKVANLAVPYFADWSAVDVANEDGGLRRLAVAHQDAEKVRLAHELMGEYPPDPQSPSGSLAVLRTGKPEIVGEITDEMLVRGTKDERHLRLIRSLGLKSYISVPLVVSGNPLGVLTFATAESGRRYTDTDLTLAVDLAHRAAVAIENTQLYQALREADRRKDEFLATLAHELRNPLAPIRNSLQILKMPRLDAATVERSRDMMERQVHQLVRLVDDLLDVSRVMRGKIELRRERVELSTVIARAVEMVQPLVEAQGHELTVQLPPESLPLDADPVRLAQVVGNLLTNAAKYTEPNGRIRLTAQREGGEAVLRVRDTGIGIAPDMLPHIFELFVQVDHASTKAQGGLGIGLTLVKNLVEMHNGLVEARSEGLGRGSEFAIRLPLTAQEERDRAEEVNGEGPHEPARSSGHRLLVVDDNQDAADSLAMLLRLQGHEVRVAHDGPAALQLAVASRPDLVFLDIGMPGMDGYEVARRLRTTPGLEKVILAALTGWGQQEDRRRTAEAGFDHHLVKPPEPKAVEGLLAELPKRH